MRYSALDCVHKRNRANNYKCRVHRGARPLGVETVPSGPTGKTTRDMKQVELRLVCHRRLERVGCKEVVEDIGTIIRHGRQNTAVWRLGNCQTQTRRSWQDRVSGSEHFVFVGQESEMSDRERRRRCTPSTADEFRARQIQDGRHEGTVLVCTPVTVGYKSF